VDLLYAGLFVRWFEVYVKKEMIAADIAFLNSEILAEAKAHPDRFLRSVQRIYKHI